MTQLLPPPQREEFDAEAIIKEARRLRRRRWLIGTIVTVVVIASIAVGITLSLHNGQSPPPVTFEGPPSLLPGQAPLDQSILVSPAGLSHGSMSGRGAVQLTVVDPANGTDRVVQPFPGNPLFTFPWIASGDDVVAVNGLNGTAGSPQVGTAAAFSPTRPQAIRTLGRASYVVDAYGPGDVWLVVDPSFDIGALAAASGCTVEEVSLAGRVIVAPRSFPCRWTIDGPAPAGLLVTAASIPAQGVVNGAILRVWNPAKDRVEARYRYALNPQVDGDSGKVVLWNKCGSNPCAPDRFTNLITRRTFVLPAVPNGWLVDSGYVLAPDGSFAAVVAISEATETALRSGPQISPPCCYFGVRSIPSELFVYNLRTDSLVESRPLMAASVVLARWSADNAYLFITLDLGHIEAVPLWSDVAPLHVTPTSGGMGLADPAESFLSLTAGK